MLKSRFVQRCCPAGSLSLHNNVNNLPRMMIAPLTSSSSSLLPLSPSPTLSLSSSSRGYADRALDSRRSGGRRGSTHREVSSPNRDWDQDLGIPALWGDLLAPVLATQTSMYDPLDLTMDAWQGIPLLNALRQRALSSVSDIRPLIDVHDGDKEITVTAEIPGMKKEDIKVQVKEGALWIKGHKKEEKVTDDRDEEGQGYHRTERMFGSFRRRIPLAAPGDESQIDPKQIKASYHAGVLKVVIPKKEAAIQDEAGCNIPIHSSDDDASSSSASSSSSGEEDTSSSSSSPSSAYSAACSSDKETRQSEARKRGGGKEKSGER